MTQQNKRVVQDLRKSLQRGDEHQVLTLDADWYSKDSEMISVAVGDVIGVGQIIPGQEPVLRLEQVEWITRTHLVTATGAFRRRSGVLDPAPEQGHLWLVNPIQRRVLDACLDQLQQEPIAQAVVAQLLAEIYRMAGVSPESASPIPEEKQDLTEVVPDGADLEPDDEMEH